MYASNKTCRCGHLKSEHLDFIDRFDKKMKLPYKEFVVKGFGKCPKCDCIEYRTG